MCWCLSTSQVAPHYTTLRVERLGQLNRKYHDNEYVERVHDVIPQYNVKLMIEDEGGLSQWLGVHY
jgi:hypothetical protein